MKHIPGTQFTICGFTGDSRHFDPGYAPEVFPKPAIASTWNASENTADTVWRILFWNSPGPSAGQLDRVRMAAQVRHILRKAGCLSTGTDVAPETDSESARVVE